MSGGQSSCAKCSIGQYQNVGGQKECTRCPAGHMSNTTGSRACIPCEAPYVTGVRDGATACDVSCSGTLYQRSAGQSSCQECSANTYFDEDTQNCVACPTGSECTPSNAEGIRSKDGYFVYRDSITGELISLSCSACVACTTGSSANLTAQQMSDLTGSETVFSCCAAHRKTSGSNPLCSTCETDYYEWS